MRPLTVAVRFQIDCGATVTVLPKRYLKPDSKIRKEHVHLRMWNSSGLNALGKCKVNVVNPATGQRFRLDCVLVEEDLTPLLSRKAAEKMRLITVNYDYFDQVNSVSPGGAAVSKFVNEFPNVFNRKVGTLPGKVHLTLEPNAEPVVRPPHNVPEALKDRVKSEIDKMADLGVLAPVDEPTDWVSQMAIAEKRNGRLRICINPMNLNNALKHEHYKLPVLDDVLPKLTNARFFSTVDLKSGFLHCELDHESSLLTTFATPFGNRYRWRRMPFGLKVSSEIFQKRLTQALEGLEGVEIIFDDITIWGTTAEEHDERMRKFLKRCDELGIALNLEKCTFSLEEISLVGHIVGRNGHRVDPEKVKAITKMPTPQCKADVERLRGMVNYLSRYVPKLSEEMKIISDLTHKDTVWLWTPAHDKAFERVKTLLCKAPVLAFFNASKELVIQSDASGKGLGAALLQYGKPIAYASRALTDCETRYATIEKEMLAVIFALEKWYQYTYGRKITVNSDHRPLESIIRKSIDKALKRLQGMLLRALAYDIDIKWMEGRKMVLADTLSRAFLKEKGGQGMFETVNALGYLTVPPDKVSEIRSETDNDEALNVLKATIQKGWPEDKSALPTSAVPYFDIRDELAVTDGLIFRGERLVVPKTLRKKMKDYIHIGHTGVEACLRRARERMYWPSMNQELKEWIIRCETCREFKISHPDETLQSHDVPSRVLEKVGTDLFSYKGKTNLITVCYFSNFWEIDRLHTEDLKTVIKKLKAHFARYGIPEKIVSDNGGHYTSDKFRKFTKDFGIEHFTISAYNSKANG
ncbi:uncharacterized protein K02A2.6-like [Lineus longissimus]|uniref:uncharacterized protein K02A2.6-like n=1 Tax=Lineus longissimus TaxID=88925 RepID=UPI00315D39C7